MAIVEAIASCYLEHDATSVEFTSIPTTYEHLQVRMTSRSTDDQAAYSGRTGNIKCRLNNSGAAIYSNGLMLGGDKGYSGTVDEDSWSNASDNYMNLSYGPTAQQVQAVYGTVIIDIHDYANTNKNATLLCLSGYGMGDYDDEGMSVNLTYGLMDDTTAVTRIKLFGHTMFVRGSSFNLYGFRSS